MTSKAELNRLTKVQLLEMADRESLSVKRSGKKSEVVNQIWAQQEITAQYQIKI